jgi:hypothetical protein
MDEDHEEGTTWTGTTNWSKMHQRWARRMDEKTETEGATARRTIARLKAL